MYIIGKKNPEGNFIWVNSIFGNNDDAENWYSKIADKTGDVLIHKIDVDSYPLYILSDPNQSELVFFLFTNDLSKVEGEIKRIDKKDLDRIYCNLYVIEDDCTNSVMPVESCIGGRTRHIHINRSFLDSIASKGIENCI